MTCPDRQPGRFGSTIGQKQSGQLSPAAALPLQGEASQLLPYVIGEGQLTNPRPVGGNRQLAITVLYPYLITRSLQEFPQALRHRH